MQETDHHWMKRALQLAEQAAAQGEVPVGALIIRDNQVISEAYNLREQNQCATAHAEILAIEQACQKLGHWRLTECTLYCTLEPCVMCAGAIVQSRLKRLVFAALDPKGGAAQSLFQIPEDPRLNHRCEVEGGLMSEESERLLKDFFKKLRSQ